MTNAIAHLVGADPAGLLDAWVDVQRSSAGVRSDLLPERELREQCRQFLDGVREAIVAGAPPSIDDPRWSEVRALLTEISRARVLKGFSPRETATFVFSLKQPLFTRARAIFAQEPERLAHATWTVTELLDALGLYTTEVHQRSREEVISRQQQELLELSTPVVQLWDRILALPLIGTLDSARTQVVMESLLQRIVDTEAAIAIIDITGVPTVDTLVAQHLLKTVAAARLMGADCVISGIRPQIAQTIVHLGVDLKNVVTKATLADAFRVALARTGDDLGARAAARE
jgi:rsbT co-antagonist protein RsbR